MRNVVIALLVLVAFFAAYRFAQASWGSQGAVADTDVANASSSGCSCCATGAAGTSAAGTEGAATVSDGIQRISVEVSGSYNPSTIALKPGVPAEITFGQSSGCTAVVQSADLGFREDLTSGPKTVRLPALKPGTYGFSCGMDMVQGQIVVK
jgi:plastocyanin